MYVAYAWVLLYMCMHLCVGLRMGDFLKSIIITVGLKNKNHNARRMHLRENALDKCIYYVISITSGQTEPSLLYCAMPS